jgi:hypothetical protein
VNHEGGTAHATGSTPGVVACAQAAVRRLWALAAAAVLLVGPTPVTVSIREQPAATALMSSQNWAGYVAHRSGAQFTSIRGAWTQPAVSCPAGGTYSSFWVGLDGYVSKDVEQIGTDADCLQADVPVYYAWYELYPAERVRIAMVVHPGDHLEATVEAVAGGTSLSLRNLTSERTFSTLQPGAAGRLTSAEWIAEAPSACSAGTCWVLPLANFGSVAFSLCSAIAAGSSGTISAPTWSTDALTMVDSSGAVIAHPSSVTSDGASFSVIHR